MRRDKEEYNAYMKEYMLKRYHSRREEAFKFLGGVCKKCGDIPIEYEFDHIDPNSKSFPISVMWSISKERFQNELVKCQILCKKCHAEKTLIDMGMNNAREVHGTISSYRYCKCDLCKKAKSDYSKMKKQEMRP